MTPEEKRARLAQLLKDKSRPASKQAPLSFAQERMWFLDKWSPGSAAFHMPTAVRLTGTVDTDALRRALALLVERHDTLRTTFQEREGGGAQVIASTGEVPLEVMDLQGLPVTEREAEAQRRVVTLAQQPFSLEQGPLLRAVLMLLGNGEQVLLVDQHHIVSDGWSMGVLVHELAVLYRACLEGQPSPLKPLPLQYADWAAWQKEWLQGAELERQLTYWKNRLNPNALLELPQDKPRPALMSSKGERQVMHLSPALTQALKALGQREGRTLFVTLLSAFNVLLSRYTGQDDIVVGTPIAGRPRAEVEGLIGLFVNMLALRSDLSGKPTFKELLNRVHESTLDAYAHQDIPFERLVDALKPERHLSHSPIFQVMFVLQNAPMPALEAPGLVMEAKPVDTGTTKYDLSLLLVDLPQGLRVIAEYSTDLFERSTAERLLGHYLTLLEGIVAQPDVPISRLPLLPDAERQRVMKDWNDTAVTHPKDATLTSLIEAQVARTPDAVALEFEGSRLTYRELDTRANQLAHALRKHGVGPEVRVGLCVERSLEMVVGLLGTLKAGGAYVPLDPGYPQERLGWMLEDARPPVLLVQERLLARLPASDAKVVKLDTGWEEIAREPTTAPAPTATPDSLAYIIFTSGSTGRPKGAMNAHGPVVNRLLWMQSAYQLTPRDVVLQKTPFSFDVSVWEFFWPLMTGAKLVVAKPGGHQDPSYLKSLIASASVTTLHFVPSMLQAFLDEPGVAECTSLKRVVCSGEALPLELKELCLRTLPGAGLHNLYGPTEAAVDVTFHACQANDGRRSVPIGRPVDNTQIRILDAEFQPVPQGAAGELYIGGVQVGRGYLARPSLTAERFIPDPYATVPGARMYRTGDVARWLPDGEIEYLGRADFQVKIRGLRIELGEIESSLEKHPTVRQAVVLAREDRPGQKRLVAYVTGKDAKPEGAALRTYLLERLPEYMVPSNIVVLERMPLSPNGKADRKALPAPESGGADPSRPFVAPGTAIEQQIAQAWKDLLHVEQVGLDDPFFELGGNSLLALQLHRRLTAELGVTLALTDLFQYPTVRALAARLSRREDTPSEDAAQAGRSRAEARRTVNRRAGASRGRVETDGDADE
ncbi:amino acid adenylation domain-containing protein [Corallococcus exiguus]|uniref:non-ribosomal peptide synthetase n=1 Tax=Corallococcus TaxID=83461 RepID=UPI000EDB07DB|nr:MULTISPECIES: non-ribosomal peptide synthetase [Corallococcus]NRD60924.1 amino acid adenylation domain-containing protein [Corallococcus exiguus]RKI11948.1 amino acid adenylation domain-containing protein [Corallococcus sp. AB030]RUO93863.1 amino acid adenylation domain-containing protein [Corallococcus sp. AB018]